MPEGEESEADSSAATVKSIGGNNVDLSFRSILANHSRWAARTLERASVPELQGFLRQQGRSTYFRELAVAQLWALNSTNAMKGLWAQAEAALDQSFEEMQVLRARAEKAEMRLEDVRATTAQALTAEIEATRLRAEKAEDALEVAQRRAANELDNAQVAEEKQREAEEALKVAESEIYMLKNRLHSATIEIGVAMERAENAEEIARQSDAKIADLKAAVTEAEKRNSEAESKVVVVEAKASEAEKRATEAERRAIEAVEDFRKSAAFNKELAETTAFAYEGSFLECKEKIKKMYGLEGLEGLEPEEVSEDDDSAPHNP